MNIWGKIQNEIKNDFNTKSKMIFLVVQDSSIGDIVSEWVSDLLTFAYTET